MIATSATTLPDRVVVGVDGSKYSTSALRWAAFLAAGTGCRLEAVITWLPPTSYGYAGQGWVGVPGDYDPAADARTALMGAVTEAFGDAAPANMVTTVQQGPAARTLLEVSSGATILVVGSRGHGGFAGLLLGSVSSTCAQHATCPVFVVHGEIAPPPPAMRSAATPAAERDAEALSTTS